MTNPLEFFAETSEAFFGENEFYPFNRTDLEQHDPETVAMLKKVWHVE
jgi:dipeptidyl-peptidase-4